MRRTISRKANMGARLLFALLLLGATFTGCRVRQTEEGEMPEVKVEGGKVPEYDVDTADVDVKKKKVEVEVPEVDYQSPEENAREEAQQNQQKPPQKPPQ